MIDPKQGKVATIRDFDKNTTVLRHVHNPEAMIMWDSAIASAKRGEYMLRGLECPHPISSMRQFEDAEVEVNRKGRPTNLWQCGICNSLLALVDPYGRRGSDG